MGGLMPAVVPLLPGLGAMFAQQGYTQVIGPTGLGIEQRAEMFRKYEETLTQHIDEALWTGPVATEAIDKFGYIMGEDFMEAMDWLLEGEPLWGTLQPREIPGRVKGRHGLEIPERVRDGLFMLKGMWETEKKRRYDDSNKALLDEYDEGRDPTVGGH